MDRRNLPSLIDLQIYKLSAVGQDPSSVLAPIKKSQWMSPPASNIPTRLSEQYPRSEHLQDYSVDTTTLDSFSSTTSSSTGSEYSTPTSSEYSGCTPSSSRRSSLSVGVSRPSPASRGARVSSHSPKARRQGIRRSPKANRPRTLDPTSFAEKDMAELLKMAKLPATEEGCRSLSQLPDDVKTKMNQNLAHKEREQRRRAIHGIAVTQFSERVPGTFKTTMNERCPEFLSETNRRKEAKATHLFGGINYIDCLEERTAFLENELRKRGIDVENLRSKETDRRIIEDNAVKLSASIKRKAEEFNVPWPPTSGSRGESRKRRKSL